jgi:CubicO group peptidase (beta-lactamase class C family)
MSPTSAFMSVASDRHRRDSSSSVAAVIIGLTLVSVAYGADTTIPWECSTYSGDAQTRCLNALIEDQGERLGKLEGQVQSQRSQMGKLQEQVDQSRAAAHAQQPLTGSPSATPAPGPYAYAYPPYAYPYGYRYPPGFGLGLNYGGPYFYGPRYWGPGYYGHWGHGGHGHHR